MLSLDDLTLKFNLTLPTDEDEAEIPQAAQSEIEDAIRVILQNIGEDPNRDGLLDTPNRIARMYGELTNGYRTDPIKLINNALFDVEYDEMVVVKGVDFYSLCEHHLLPFYGKAHIAYVPEGKVVGLSKLPRIVEMFAQRLQVQERMTADIANFIEDMLEPQGVAVVVEGVHMCCAMRGVKNAGANMVTSSVHGIFKTNAITRSEFMNHLNRRHFED